MGLELFVARVHNIPVRCGYCAVYSSVFSMFSKLHAERAHTQSRCYSHSHHALRLRLFDHTTIQDSHHSHEPRTCTRRHTHTHTNTRPISISTPIKCALECVRMCVSLCQCTVLRRRTLKYVCSVFLAFSPRWMCVCVCVVFAMAWFFNWSACDLCHFPNDDCQCMRVCMCFQNGKRQWQKHSGQSKRKPTPLDFPDVQHTHS